MPRALSQMLLGCPRSRYLENKSHSTGLPILLAKALCLQAGSLGLRKTSVHLRECTHRNGQSSLQRSCQLWGKRCYLRLFTQANRSLIPKPLKSFQKFSEAMSSECPDAHTPLSSPCALTQPPGSPLRGSESLQTLSRTKQATGGGAAFFSNADAIAKSEAATGKCGDVVPSLGPQRCPALHLP